MALDIIDGMCVRLTRGDYTTKKIYSENPLEIAKDLEENGIRYLHLVDLDGAKNRKITNYRILEKISSATKLNIEFGGGLRSEDDIETAFNSGAKQVIISTIAVTCPALFMEWLTRYGNNRIILGADFKERKVVSAAWTESSEKDIISFVSSWYSQGVSYAVCTDMERDGMMNGPATEIYREILRSAKINLIASGGISSLKDIEDIKIAGCEGVIIGKAIYEGRIKLKELSSLC